MRCGLVADEQFLGRVRLEEQDAGFIRDAEIFLVQNGAAKGEAFQVAGVAVGVGAGEDALAIRQPAIEQVGADKSFSGSSTIL